MLREFQKEIEKLRRKLEEDETSADDDDYEEGEGLDDEGAELHDGKKRRKRKKKNKGCCYFLLLLFIVVIVVVVIVVVVIDELSMSLSPKAMAELKEQIEKERVKLRVDKNMVLAERNTAQTELEKKEGELKKAQ